MDEIRFAFEGTAQDTLTWDDIEVLESGQIGGARNIIARFVVDDDNKEVPFDEAKKKLGQLKISQVQEVLERFSKLMSEAAVNPTTADS